MESEIDPGMAASMWGDAMTALNDWRGRAERAEAEVERLTSERNTSREEFERARFCSRACANKSRGKEAAA